MIPDGVLENAGVCFAEQFPLTHTTGPFAEATAAQTTCVAWFLYVDTTMTLYIMEMRIL